jgi:threonine synthase
MDVGNPSNFIRIMELFHQQYHEIKTILSAYSINDEETFNTIRNVYKDYQYTLDPHGAVGYLSLEKYLASHPDQKGIFLETAHPVKFPEVVEEAIQKRIEIPEQLRELMQKEKKAVFINPDYELLKEYLMSCE